METETPEAVAADDEKSTVQSLIGILQRLDEVAARIDRLTVPRYGP